MGLLYADYGGIPVVRAQLRVSFSGLWTADIILDRAYGVAPTGPQALSLVGMQWTCTPIRSIDYTGTREVRAVAGTAGWRNPIPAQQYASPAGVPTAVVCSDAAAAAGELPPVVDPSQPQTLGTAFLRQAGPASLVLEQLFGSTWWTDPTGTVQTAPRSVAPILSQFDLVKVEGPKGRYIVATEHPGDWMPGRSFASPTASGVVSRVCFDLEQGQLRLSVLGQ